MENFEASTALTPIAWVIEPHQKVLHGGFLPVKEFGESFLTSERPESLWAALLICEKCFCPPGPSGRCYFLRCVLPWPRLPAFPVRLALCLGQSVTVIFVLSLIFTPFWATNSVGIFSLL